MQIALFCQTHQLPRLVSLQRHWLFDHDMATTEQGCARMFIVKVVGRGDDYSVEVLRQQLAIIGIEMRRANPPPFAKDRPLLGMGIVAPGDVGVPTGWSAPAQMVLDTPLLDPQMRTWTGVHVVPEGWVLESNASETGRAWAWLAELMSLTDAEADALVAASPPGANDAMAVVGARRMTAHAMSAGVGALTMPLPLVMSAPSRGDLLRSVMESIAYAIRANIEQLEEVSGRNADRVAIGGGMSRGPLPRILADVLGRPIEVARAPETSAIGAAILTAVAVGIHPSLEAAIEAMAGGRATIQPDPAVSAAYDDLYDRWCAMADELASGLL